MPAPEPLHPDLKLLLETFRAKRAFDPVKWIDQKTDMLNKYMRDCGLKACLVSLSGGVDSATCFGLMLAAQKKKDSPIKRALSIAQPIHSTDKIWKRAQECATKLGGEVITVDQTDQESRLVDLVTKSTGIAPGMFSRGQLRSYMRTPVNYYTAQLLSQEGLPCIVIGTGNFDEDGYMCYFCKAGDGVVDVQLIADLHKSEVFKVAAKLGVPDSILVAAPSADLWEGQTDEEELGMTYDFVELFTEWMKLGEKERAEALATLSPAALKQFKTSGAAAETVHRRNAHKLHFPHNLNVM